MALRAPGLGVTPPRAVGVRAPYVAVPARVRDWVDTTLGSPVVAHTDVTGGMSPGCATRLRCADGTRAFLKAVGSELNPVTPTLFRREIHALTLLGSDPLWADLLATYDDDGWVALLLEDVEGRHPDLSDDAEMALLVEATDRLVPVLAERVAHDPGPGPAGVELNHTREVFRAWREAFDDLADVPGDLAPRWLRERADEFAARTDLLVEQARGEQLVHWDIRNDNLLLRPSGQLVFLDWGGASLGMAWLDPLLARLERVEDPWFDASLAGSPALAEAGDEAVTSWLVGIGAFLAWRAHVAVDINLPTLNDFRRTESARFLGAAARRLGVD